MKQVKFNIHDNLLNFILLGHDVNGLCSIFNMKEKNIKEMLKVLRNDIFDSFDEKNFYIIKLIDSLIGKCTLNKMSLDVIDMIVSGNDPYVICGYCKISIFNYISLLKSIYAYLYIYGTKTELNKIDKVRNEILICNEIADEIRNTKYKAQELYINNDKVVINTNFKNGFTSNSIVRNIVDIGEKDYLRFLAVSDTHAGNLGENFAYLDTVYEYASKHGIKIITHSGDVIEGCCDNYNNCNEIYSTAMAQIEHVLEDFLYDENIKIYILLGNHDASIMKSDKIDVFDELMLRSDFVPLGYRQAFIKCGQDYISLKHDLPRMINPCGNEETVINLVGHAHTYFATHNYRTCSFKVPTLSDVSPNGDINTGFLDIQVWFENCRVVEVTAEYIPLSKEQNNSIYVNKLTI